MINISIFYILKFDIRKREYNVGPVTVRMSRGEICIVLFYLELGKSLGNPQLFRVDYFVLQTIKPDFLPLNFLKPVK